jgi:hypothetical protein
MRAASCHCIVDARVSLLLPSVLPHILASVAASFIFSAYPPFKCMHCNPALIRLFSGSHLYSTTLMPNWRVRQHAELVDEYTRSLFRLNMLVQCDRKKGTH